MRDALTAASDRLNERLVTAERCIVDRAPKVRASVPLGGEGVVLVYGREQGAWGLFVQHAHSPPMPLLKASREYRVLAAHALDDLLIAIGDARVAMTGEVEEAISAIDTFIAAHSTPTGDPNEGI